MSSAPLTTATAAVPACPTFLAASDASASSSSNNFKFPEFPVSPHYQEIQRQCPDIPHPLEFLKLQPLVTLVGMQAIVVVGSAMLPMSQSLKQVLDADTEEEADAISERAQEEVSLC